MWASTRSRCACPADPTRSPHRRRVVHLPRCNQSLTHITSHSHPHHITPPQDGLVCCWTWRRNACSCWSSTAVTCPPLVTHPTLHIHSHNTGVDSAFHDHRVHLPSALLRTGAKNTVTLHDTCKHSTVGNGVHRCGHDRHMHCESTALWPRLTTRSASISSASRSTPISSSPAATRSDVLINQLHAICHSATSRGCCA